MIGNANSRLFSSYATAQDCYCLGRQGAHSNARPSLRPQNDSSCPACEPPLDTAGSFAASSTTAPQTCGPPLLWPHRGACAGPGVCTPAPTLRLLVPRSCPPAPGETS